MRAIKIKMKTGCKKSCNCLEIDSIFITGCEKPGYYKKDVLHDYVKDNPGSIQVDIYPHPNLIDSIGPAPNYEKYVKSSPNDTSSDNLLQLPRE